MSNFDSCPRRLQELKGRPIADIVYKGVFGDDIIIKRFERAEDLILDIKFSMDVFITLRSGLILTGQEKFLSPEQAKFKSVTVEYMQNPITGEQGDWYKLGVQLYFTGYFHPTKDDFAPWILLDWPAVVIATHHGLVNWMDNKNKDGSARASFKYAFMDKIPEDCIIAKKFVLPNPPRVV